MKYIKSYEKNSLRSDLIVDQIISIYINGFKIVKKVKNCILIFTHITDLIYDEEPDERLNSLASNSGVIVTSDLKIRFADRVGNFYKRDDDEIVIFIVGDNSGNLNWENEDQFEKILKIEGIKYIPDFDKIKNEIELHQSLKKYNL